MKHFSFNRLKAMMVKEFIQIKRNHLTIAILVVIPIMQLIIFGYAINNKPIHLPTAVFSSDNSAFTRAFIKGLENTNYFSITKKPSTEKEAENLLATGKVQFIISIPSNFSRSIVRGERPQVLLDGDATDPVATSSAMSAIPILIQTIFDPLMVGNLAFLHNKSIQGPINLIMHAKYNPESITAYNIVPGLLGVILTMTMVMVTSLAITKEREIGTMENLLSTPMRPLEAMIGKMFSYIIIGYIQVAIILIMAILLFAIPVFGSLWLLLLAALPFIFANLAVGLTFSSIAQNQLQAVQMTFFFFLPSLLLSGFMFPFRGMPIWAQWVGSIFPLTHFLRIVRGILLKGNTFIQIWPSIWPILVFLVIVLTIGASMYKKTID